MIRYFQFAVRERTLHITFNSATNANALSLDAAIELEQILRAHRSKCDRLVLRSAHPRIFCSGGDLKFYGKLKSKIQGLKSNRKIHRALESLQAWPGRTLAIVEGDCLGGGVELLSAFDEVWATPFSQFAFWQRRLSLSFGWGGYQRLLRRMSESQIKGLSLSGQRISAFQAHQLNLIDSIARSEVLEERLQEWHRSDMQMSQNAGKALKKLSAKHEQKTFASLWWSSEHLKVLRQFLAR